MRRQPEKPKVLKPERGKLRKSFRFTPRVQGMLEYLMQNPNAPKTENAMVQQCIVAMFMGELYSKGLLTENPEEWPEGKPVKLLEQVIEELLDPE